MIWCQIEVLVVHVVYKVEFSPVLKIAMLTIWLQLVCNVILLICLFMRPKCQVSKKFNSKITHHRLVYSKTKYLWSVTHPLRAFCWGTIPTIAAVYFRYFRARLFKCGRKTLHQFNVSSYLTCIALVCYSVDGGKNPTFQEKFVFTLIEGLREINVVVWNSNTVTFDDLIGSGRYICLVFFFPQFDKLCST